MAWGGGVYLASVWRRLHSYPSKRRLLYCRYLPGAVLGALLGFGVVFEAHQPPEGGVNRALWRWLVKHPALLRFVPITENLRQHLEREGLAPADASRIRVAHSGADSAPVVTGPSPIDTATGFHVGYVGSLNPGKGAEIALELARRVPDATVHVVGGGSAEVDAMRTANLPANVVIHGFVPSGDLERYRQAFDVLLLPAQETVLGATSQANIADWMSPLKLFEYMASGRAIVASKLPVLLEVLDHEVNALLVPPSDLDAWAAAVRRLTEDEALRERLAHAARRDFEAQYTWDARAHLVLDGIVPDAHPRAARPSGEAPRHLADGHGHE